MMKQEGQSNASATSQSSSLSPPGLVGSDSGGALGRLFPRCSPAPLEAPRRIPSLATPWRLKRECEATLIKI